MAREVCPPMACPRGEGPEVGPQPVLPACFPRCHHEGGHRVNFSLSISQVSSLISYLSSFILPLVSLISLICLSFFLSFSKHSRSISRTFFFLSLSVVCLSVCLSLSVLWTRNEGPRTGSRQRQHSTAVRITVIVYAIMTTEENHRLSQKRLVIGMKSPPVATSPTSTSSFSWELGRLCSLRATCALIPDACGTFSDVAVLATFIACVVLDAHGEAAAFWACHMTHAIIRTKLPGRHGDAEGSLILG